MMRVWLIVKTGEPYLFIVLNSTQAIRNFSEDAIINYFHDQSSFNFQCTFNPLEKIMELYERLLQVEREKNELLKGNK